MAAIRAIMFRMAFFALFFSANGDDDIPTDHLAHYISIEKDLTISLSKYVEELDTNIQELKRFLENIELIHSNITLPKRFSRYDIPDLLDGNVLQTFQIAIRLSRHWKKSLRPFKTQEGENNAIITKLEKISIPTDEEVNKTAQELLKLQHVYNFNTKELAKGNLADIHPFIEMQAEDCYYLGKIAFELGLYSYSLEWFDHAYKLASEKHSEVLQKKIYKSMKIAQEEFDNILNYNVDDETIEGYLQKEFAEDHMMLIAQEYEQVPYQLGQLDGSWDDVRNQNALCRGEKLLSEKYLSTLDCYYSTRGSPYFILMPVKVEQLHHDPLVLMLHDVIADAEIETMKVLATPDLSRGKVYNPKGNYVSKARTSKVMWLLDTQFTAKLNKDVRELTGLSTYGSNAERYQVAYYGSGGHYDWHWDFLRPQNKEEEKLFLREIGYKGDRIATLMYYLSETEKGGATVFPRLGVTVWPVKGSAVFWYNLKKSGEGDKLTAHAGCPVVHGSKWVSNKWIRERGQFLRRPCGLESNQ